MKIHLKLKIVTYEHNVSEVYNGWKVMSKGMANDFCRNLKTVESFQAT